MRARAPGKVVMSGAYSVLHGAPAIVCAVDRYVSADSSRAPEWIGPEVRRAFGARAIPHSNASALREGERKLGLGSSAAVLVASLAAAEPASDEPVDSLRRRLQPVALEAHYEAQGGGSGVDVLASIWGGVLIVQRDSRGLTVTRAKLPSQLVTEVWASGQAASTSNMLAAVRNLSEQAPSLHSERIAVLKQGAEESAQALREGNCRALLQGLSRQATGLADLGKAAKIPIVTPEVAILMQNQGEAVVLPAGAGGGDIFIRLAKRRSDVAFRELAQSMNHRLLDMHLGAHGVHRQPTVEVDSD